MRRIGMFVALPCLVSVLACGGSGSPAGPTGPTRAVIAQGSVQLGDPATALSQDRLCDILAFVPFTTSAQGALEVTVDWTHASNDVDVLLERGDCNCALALAGDCQDLAGSESTTAKPERLAVANLSAGGYTLVVANAGPGRESASYELALTR